MSAWKIEWHMRRTVAPMSVHDMAYQMDRMTVYWSWHSAVGQYGGRTYISTLRMLGDVNRAEGACWVVLGAVAYRPRIWGYSSTRVRDTRGSSIRCRVSVQGS
eukprot:1698467-Rhodomonas_salina.1